MNKPTRFYSNRQEKKVARMVGGKQQSNSGAGTFQKGDVITDEILIECKTATKEKSSFSIKHEWLTKNKEEALAMGRYYNALCFDFGDGGERYYVIDERMFRHLVQFIKEANEWEHIRE